MPGGFFVGTMLQLVPKVPESRGSLREPTLHLNDTPVLIKTSFGQEALVHGVNHDYRPETFVDAIGSFPWNAPSLL